MTAQQPAIPTPPDPTDADRLSLVLRAVESQTDHSAYDPSVSPESRGIIQRWVFYTPEMAAEVMLQRNPNNRSLSEATVEMYRIAMERGLWKPIHQGAAFDVNGDILDGQHRFAALAKAKIKGIWMLVTYNLPVGYFSDIDKGKRRSAFQFLPGKNTTTKAAALRSMSKHYPGLVAQSSGVSDLDIYLRYLEISENMDQATDLAVSVYHACRIHSTYHAAMLAVVLSEGTPEVIEKVPDWIEGLRTGADMAAGDPRLTLRNRFLRDADYLNSSAARAECLSLILRAWEKYVSGQRIAKIQVPKAGLSSTTPQHVKITLKDER